MLEHYKKHIGCSTPITNWETILELKYAKYWTFQSPWVKQEFIVMEWWKENLGFWETLLFSAFYW